MKTIALLLLCLATTTATAQDPYRSRDHGYTAFWTPYSMVVYPSCIPMQVPSQKLTYLNADALSGALRNDCDRGSSRNSGYDSRNSGYDSRNRINIDCYRYDDSNQRHGTQRTSNSNTVHPGGWIENPFFNGL